jgi:hypothetical protein
MPDNSTLNGRIDYERLRALPTDLDLEPITSEDEDYESAPADYQISTYPADFTLEVLHSKWKENQILIPELQRSFVWKQVQSSKLIESFLVGLPVPAVFFYSERKSQKYFVIDGQQGLKSIFYFFEGYFGAATEDTRRIFRLNGLSSLSRFGEPDVLNQPPLFSNVIPQTITVARGADVDADIRTFKGKYGFAYDGLRGLTQEIKQLCETKKH